MSTLMTFVCKFPGCKAVFTGVSRGQPGAVLDRCAFGDALSSCDPDTIKAAPPQDALRPNLPVFQCMYKMKMSLLSNGWW